MAKSSEKPFFHVILSDRDEWVVEAEWSDSTLERVSTFGDYSAAADWIANQSEAWLARLPPSDPAALPAHCVR